MTAVVLVVIGGVRVSKCVLVGCSLKFYFVFVSISSHFISLCCSPMFDERFYCFASGIFIPVDACAFEAHAQCSCTLK